ncbi:CatB-related O-acetyltransferase [Pseudomonas eucalypticola]|uniref:Chloramphenicol acetyltransferase n=1 Tax=Pseudomonas eucalypticola TaxID=2599595 RepID=A0A7D5H334_9PSED|nr:CatB-related O-acetyltransferase [Pseudomonas eucalypticola]QKZ02609.1 CatB-related O-acetyltransferase [Pseudomonas eucalypticola]
MNMLKRMWLDHTLKRALRQHRCRVDCGIRGLRGKVKLTLERNVKLHGVKVFSKDLRIGAFTDIVSNTELRDVSSIGRYCSIGTNCVLGQNRKQHPMDWLSTNVALIDTRLQAMPSPPADWDVTPTTIGHDVWVGRDVIIMEGITIGTGAVIGAQSLVTRDVPPYAVVAGSPAKMIRYRFDEPLREQLLASRWWEHDHSELAQLPTEDPAAFLAALAKLPPKPISDATVQVSTSPLRIKR